MAESVGCFLYDLQQSTSVSTIVGKKRAIFHLPSKYFMRPSLNYRTVVAVATPSKSLNKPLQATFLLRGMTLPCPYIIGSLFQQEKPVIPVDLLLLK